MAGPGSLIHILSLTSPVHNNQKYYRKIINAFGSSLLGYWPMGEAAGNTATDKSGLAHHASYNGTKTLGQIGIGDGKTSALFVTGSTSGLNVYAASPVNMAEGFIAFWCAATNAAMWADGGMYYLATLQSDGTHHIVVRKYLGVITGFRRVDANLPLSSVAPPSTTRWLHYAFVWSVAQQKVWSYINGTKTIPTAGTLAAQTDNLNASNAMIGANSTSGTNGFPGRMAHGIVGSGLPSKSQMRIAARCSAQVVFDGDSRSTETTLWPANAMETAFPSGLLCYGGRGYASWAVSGNTTANMIAVAAAGVDTLIVPGGRNVLVIWAGVNSSATGAAQIYADYQTYITARRTAGWNKIILCSEIDAVTGTWHASVWPALNALLAADHSFADGFVDLGADARLQNASDATYYNADKIHLTAAGYAVVSSLVAPVLAGF